MKFQTDSQDELFDLVNEQDEVIGETTRREVHKDKSLIHRSIGVVIFNKKGELYMQKRSANKDIDPGKWTISCSGHVGKGDSYEKAALRELEEEIGITTEIKSVIKFLHRDVRETEIMMLFQGEHEGPFKLEKKEISEGKFFTQKELIRALEKGNMNMSNSGKETLVKYGWLSH